MNATTLIATASVDGLLPDFSYAPSDIRRMWEGGPLRQFSDKQAATHYVAYSSPILKGYAGAYVCDRCLKPCAGIYFVKSAKTWFCGGCRTGSLERPS